LKTTRAAIMTLLLAGAAFAQNNSRTAPPPSLEGLFLEYSKAKLGRLRQRDPRSKYIYTIQAEKTSLMSNLLRTVYDNAYEMYKQGDYDGARELTAKILKMDPAFQDAAILHQASVELDGSGGSPLISGRQMIESRFDAGMALYRQGRLEDAAKKWEEVVKLSPGNLKARYWMKRVKRELADEHFRRGQKAYRQHRLSDALNQWYAALVLHPKYPRLISVISKAESELRRQDANARLQQALKLYGEGKTESALAVLDEVLRIEPSEGKARKLIAEIRLEIAKRHVSQGRKLYGSGKYALAIRQWNTAIEYGYDPRRANILITRARRQIKREVTQRRRRAEAKRQAKEEAKRRAEEETRRRAEEEVRRKEEEARRLDATPPEEPAESQPTTEESKRLATKHWNSGIIYYQKGDYEKARDEWVLCLKYDPGYTDCKSGLQKLDNTFGGGL